MSDDTTKNQDDIQVDDENQQKTDDVKESALIDETTEKETGKTEEITEEEKEEKEGEEGEEGETEEEEEEEEEETSKETDEKNREKKEKSLGKTKGKQARGTGRNWYVIHTYSGYEDAVEKSLRQRIETFNMQDYIFDVIVPKESAISIKKGSHVTEKIRMFPGYVLVDMIVTDDSWYVVRNTPNVTGFVGSGTIPVPVLPEEFDRIKKHVQADEPTYKVKFQIGENVQIIDGPFKDCEGIVDDIDEKKGRAKILVNVFGRETPIELEFTQIKKKD